jgi:hypothetical protein
MSIVLIVVARGKHVLPVRRQVVGSVCGACCGNIADWCIGW